MDSGTKIFLPPTINIYFYINISKYNMSKYVYTKIVLVVSEKLVMTSPNQLENYRDLPILVTHLCIARTDLL
jgi:hypothetical protein